MIVVVTRNVAPRIRGFLASCMLEIAPGVYTAVRMSAGVRDRVWAVLTEWFLALDEESSVVMTWRDPKEPGGQGVRTLGSTPHAIADHEGVRLCRRRPTAQAGPAGQGGDSTSAAAGDGVTPEKSAS